MEVTSTFGPTVVFTITGIDQWKYFFITVPNYALFSEFN